MQQPYNLSSFDYISLYFKRFEFLSSSLDKYLSRGVLAVSPSLSLCFTPLFCLISDRLSSVLLLGARMAAPRLSRLNEIIKENCSFSRKGKFILA